MIMRYSIILFLAIMAMAGTGLAADDLQTQSPNTTVQSFTPVEGADLMARLDAAQAKARARQTPYWSAYTFDVRPGVAVDPAIREFNGSINTFGDTSVFVGTTSGGMTVETRNLAIFLLRDPASNQITRMEVYNLERKREYSGYPVYWLGRANNEESLNYLRALAAAAPLDRLSERAVLGIALHDDARVGGMLKNFITSPNQRIRSSAVYWLGQVGGEQAFLASLVRNDAEDKEIRRSAAYGIGRSRDHGTVATLQGLYESVKDVEIRRSIISAAGNSTDEQLAFTFLLGVAKNDPDWESRRTAIRQLGHFERADAVEQLIKIYGSDSNVEIKKAVLRSLSENKGARAEDKLFEIARSNEPLDVRRQAIRVLGERVSQRSFDFLSTTAQSTDANAEVQVQAVRAIGERRAEESVPLLIKIARTHPNQLVRKQAIRSLGESGDPRAIEFFREVLSK
ncbi:MAG TPA: HEAT repeat domain-containing protein [Pyrinomonadaceae bacterium]|nr:HEAT repeat domain-containing protein [Pyrinomonadaceae bacterium]